MTKATANKDKKIAKKLPSYQFHYKRKYGLGMQDRDSDGSPTSLRCNFCHFFGREAKVEAKRSPKAKTQIYAAGDLRTSNIERHLKEQHPVKWNEYQGLGDSQKDSIFEGVVQFRGSIDKHFGKIGVSVYCKYEVPRNVVVVIIGELLADEGEEGSKQWWPKAFGDCIQQREDKHLNNCVRATVKTSSRDELTKDFYTIIIPNSNAFNFVMSCLKAGLSFRACEFVCTSALQLGGASQLGVINRQKIATWAQWACAINYTNIMHILRNSWTASIALDMSDHMSTGYFAIRVRVFYAGKLLNLHIRALPIKGRHTANNLFNHFQRLFDVLYKNWRTKLLSVASDGEAKMTGCHVGFVTQVQQQCQPGFIRIWCGAHQFDLAIEAFYTNLLDEVFYKDLTHLIAWLRRQKNFCHKVGTIGTVSTCRWSSMYKVTIWLKKNIVEVMSIVDEMNAEILTDREKFWLTLSIVNNVATAAEFTFKGLQHTYLLIEQQREYLQSFCKTMTDMFAITEGTNFNTPKSTPIPIQFNAEAIIDSWNGYGMTIAKLVQHASTSVKLEVAQSIGNAALKLLQDTSEILVERDRNNAAINTVPMVMPRKVLEMRPRDLVELIDVHHARLSTYFTKADLEAMTEELILFRAAHVSEDSVQKAVNNYPDSATFEEAWEHIAGRFPLLYELFGGLATVFPGTTSVESGFLELKWAKDEHSMLLSDFSLEAKLHAKQWLTIENIVPK